MNKTKQEMLALVDSLDEFIKACEVDNIGTSDELHQLRTLITDSVILSDGEIEGMDHGADTIGGVGHWEIGYSAGYNEALDVIKDIGK